MECIPPENTTPRNKAPHVLEVFFFGWGEPFTHQVSGIFDGLIDLFIDFDGTSSYLGLLSAIRLGNPVHIYIFVLLFHKKSILLIDGILTNTIIPAQSGYRSNGN